MWPFNKKREGKGPKIEGKSAGGSNMLRYSGHEFDNPQFGILGEETIKYGTMREKLYEDMFGPIRNVFHEVLPIIPHIDVYQFEPGYKGRNFWTLVTGGMSDLAMTLPEGVPEEMGRVELVFYCDSLQDSYLHLLRHLAHFPHDNSSWLGPGHTMPNGNPPSPLFSDTSALNASVFIESIVRPDNQLGERLVIEQVPVNLLWVVPISSRECMLKLNNGIDAIYDLFDSKQHSHVFQGDRKSYV